jgi:hypothetical protein
LAAAEMPVIVARAARREAMPPSNPRSNRQSDVSSVILDKALGAKTAYLESIAMVWIPVACHHFWKQWSCSIWTNPLTSLKAILLKDGFILT